MEKKIEFYQFEDLNANKILINKYDMDLKYSYELKDYWKIFFFDILDKYLKNNTITDKKDLFDFLYRNYEKVIKDYQLNIDKKDYIEITDYILFNEWLNDDNNSFKQEDDGIILIHRGLV